MVYWFLSQFCYDDATFCINRSVLHVKLGSSMKRWHPHLLKSCANSCGSCWSPHRPPNSGKTRCWWRQARPPCGLTHWTTFCRWHFQMYFFIENVWISSKISLKFVPKGPINNIPALVQIMAWRCPGDKPLSESMMVSLPMHICLTRPQWVKAMTSH